MAAIQPKKLVVFFGDSITAGYGLDPEQSFPHIIQQKIDQAGYNYEVVNAGLSGETSAGGVARINWILQRPVDVFVLELGANDGLRGLPLEQTRKNLQTIIDKVRQKNPSAKIIIAGMQMPPNMGQDYISKFKQIFPELAQKNNTALIPFLLEDVGGNPQMNQADGIHPNAEGHQILADNVWEVLEPLLNLNK
ncbi:MAG: arylesterase [Candidatus Cyclobacteriaceae bacterium M3_2C_046]